MEKRPMIKNTRFNKGHIPWNKGLRKETTQSDLEKRFWVKVEKTEGCWLWKAAKNGNGYGIIYANRTLKLAHRIAYELEKGRIPNNLTLDHLCRNHLCVNPEHLQIVSNRENILRGFGASAINARKEVCPRGHALIEGNLVKHGNKFGRDCLTCHRDRQSQRNHENSEREKRNAKKESIDTISE